MAKVLIVGDPWDRIRPHTDTSLALGRELLRRGHEVYWSIEAALSWERDRAFAETERIRDVHASEPPTVETSSKKPLEDFSAILIRKDPPFDETYLRLCWILRPYEHEIKIFARPSILLQYHEKMIPLQLLKLGLLNLAQIMPPWMPGELHRFRSLVTKMEEPPRSWVTKPWLGYQGNQVELLPHDQLSEWRPSETYFIAQEFEERVRTEGDRRVFFVQGKYAGDFVRLPAPESIISNLAQGGSAKLAPLSTEEKAVIQKLEQWLTKEEILLAGADLIAGKLNEVNITSPTGLVVFEKLTGINLSERVVDAVLSQTKER